MDPRQVNKHRQSWKKGMKSLYYCRSLSIQRADTVSNLAVKEDILNKGDQIQADTSTSYEECLSCQ